MGENLEWRLAEKLARDIETSNRPVAIRLRDVRDDHLGQERLTLHRRRELQRAFDAAGLTCSIPLTDADLDEAIEVSLARAGAKERLRRWIARPVLRGVRWVAILLGLAAAIVALYPLTQGPAAPKPMSGDVNLVVTGFVDQQSEAAGEALGDTVFRSLRTSTRTSDNPADPDIQVRGPNAVSSIDSPEQAERVARENGAQIVVYGRVVHRESGTVALPRFYVDPALLTGAEELGGDFPLPRIEMGDGGVSATIPGRARLRTAVSEDFHGLSTFAIGLGWFNEAQWRRAHAWFAQAQEQWRKGTGAALSNLFVGNTAGKLGDLAGAQSAYLRALNLAPNLGRAELGLTEVELHRAAPSCPDRVTIDALAEAAEKFARLYDEAGGSGLPRQAFLLRSRLGEARAYLCLGLRGFQTSAEAAALGFREVLRLGSGIESFNPELAEARAGLGLSVLQGEPEDERRAYLRAKTEYERAQQLTNDPARAEVFAEMIDLIDAHLEESVWSRADPLPAGVRAEIEYYGVGDSICGPVIPPEPKILLDQRPFYQFEMVPGAEKPELGETLSICPRGFDASEPLLLTVEGPGKFERRTTLPPVEDDRERHVAYWLNREWPPGAYSAVASQEGRTIRLRFPVSFPLHRGVRSPEGFAEPITSSSWPVMVIGQPPNSKVTVDVYGDRHDPRSSMERHFRYTTSFELTTDEHGIAEIELPPRADDEGTFFLRVRGLGSYFNQDLVTGISICDGGEC